MTRHTKQQVMVETMLSAMQVPFKFEVEFKREEWRCKIHDRVSGSLEEMMRHRTLKHSDYPFTRDVIEQKVYAVDIMLWETEVLEIWGSGTTSFKKKRQEWFKQNHPELHFHYISNDTVERHLEEEVQQYVERMIEIESFRAHFRTHQICRLERYGPLAQIV